jgi:curved DNA-binding protein CbpA
MSEPRNPYKILGLSQEDDPSRDDIKKAYRKLSARYHPDRNPGNADAEKKFKEVNAAYQFLTNGKYHDMFEEYAKQQGYENPVEHAFEMFMQVWDKVKPGIEDIQERGKEVIEHIRDKTKDKFNQSGLDDSKKKVSDFLKSDSIEKASDQVFDKVDEGLSKVGLSTGLKGKGKNIGRLFNKLGSFIDKSDDDQGPDQDNQSVSGEDLSQETKSSGTKKNTKRRNSKKGNGPGPS